jgi:hypothetical protein
MSALYSDTDPKVEARQIGLIRRMLANLLPEEELARRVYGEIHRAE